MQSGAMELVAKLCEILDKDEITPILEQFLPTVITNFNNIMQTIGEQQYSTDQIDFITSVLGCLKNSVDIVPVAYQ